MKRKFESYLLDWREQGKEKMPLLIYGARQIGKTYLLQQFGETEYKKTIYMNFETNPALAYLFSENIDPAVIVPKIEEYFKTDVSPSDTLIIFDEIQSCNRALTSLKYFCEKAPQYDIIGAGSLLGVHTSSADSAFPVGKVITKTMHPMSFEEFLWESDKAVFAPKIKECFDNDTPMEQGLHESLLELYKQYLIVGGMPLAVKNYFTGNKMLSFSEVQRIIIDTQVSDMTRYTDRLQGIKTINAYDSIVPQLAKDNRKFQYKLIAKGGRASLFGESIDWLLRAGVAVKAVKTKRGDMPPGITADLSAFKLYLCDAGLASYKAGLTRANMDIFDNTYLGGITENYVANTLFCNGYELFYWESEAKAEVDFVIMRDGNVIPVEVKSSDRTRSYSLNSYMKKYSPAYAVRISSKNFGFDSGIKSVPLYAAYLV